MSLLSNHLGAAAAPSAISSGPGEGFVVRLAASFGDDAFERSVAKYVRANHVQTAPDFRRSWRKVPPHVHCCMCTACPPHVRCMHMHMRMHMHMHMHMHISVTSADWSRQRTRWSRV